jgi:CRP-like cAMP-binding protein
MALDDDIALLRRLDFFDVFEADQLRLMLFAADRRMLRPNETLFMLGEPADDGYLVQSGLIALLGDANTVVEQARRGMLIGEYALLAPSERPVTAVAREATSVIVLPRKLIQRLLTEYPDVAFALREKLAERANRFSDALAGIAP